jgi:hypothetical protein
MALLSSHRIYANEWKNYCTDFLGTVAPQCKTFQPIKESYISRDTNGNDRHMVNLSKL